MNRTLWDGLCSELLLLSALETVFLLQNSLCSVLLMVLTVCWVLRKCVWFVSNSTNWKRSRQVLHREKREDKMQGYVCQSLNCYSSSFSISFSCPSWHYSSSFSISFSCPNWHFRPFLDHFLSLHAFPLPVKPPLFFLSLFKPLFANNHYLFIFPLKIFCKRKTLLAL